MSELNKIKTYCSFCKGIKIIQFYLNRTGLFPSDTYICNKGQGALTISRQFGSGGSALIAKIMGEDRAKAKQPFKTHQAEIRCKSAFKAVTNGFPELLSNISMSVVSMLYNIQLMKYAGEDGVAAYDVLMYVSMIFLAIFIGIITLSSPGRWQVAL